MRTRWAIVLLLALIASSALPAQSQQQRQRAFAALPDWTGLWLPDDGVMTRLTLRNDVQGDGPGFETQILNAHPPYNAAWETKSQARRNDPAVMQSSKECGFYFPGVMESPSIMQALVTPEETTLVFAGREIRHIYTDGRKHPPADELWPTPWGDSVGHWVGQTLVVETVAVATQMGPYSPLMSDRVRFVERIRRINRDHFEDQLTFVDPIALTRPWTVTIPYVRLTNLDRMIHGDCLENDRNPAVNGNFTIVPP